MPSLSSPQVYPFRHQLNRWVTVTHDGDRLKYHLAHHELVFLEELLEHEEPPTFTVEAGSEEQLAFWRELLDYGPNDELHLVGHQGQIFAAEALEDWPDEAEYEYMVWSQQRQKYEVWLARIEALRDSLPEPHDWQQPPDEKQLRNLEYRAAHTVPQRESLLKSLHVLGLLAPEDGGQRSRLLAELGCHRLLRWREAALKLRWVARFVDGALPDGHQSLLESPLGLEWFLEGPYQQKYLDPLNHLRFALHHHLRQEPPEVNSSFVVSMGGRFSGAFFYQLGPGRLPQLVGGGEPPPDSKLYPLYGYELTSAGDRVAEVSARAIRLGFPHWGGRLARCWLQQEPEQGQCWVELGVALSDHQDLAKACLQRARELGHDFRTDGELSALWQAEATPLAELDQLDRYLERWQQELEALPEEELTALVMMAEVVKLPGLTGAWQQLALPPVLSRWVQERLEP